MSNIKGPRRLGKEEHGKTRKLWEEVFSEDTKEFLDYYYSVKTADNEIYVMEDGDRIVSMLHLNPYQMRIKDKIYQTHYIVAVATDVNYRKRGYMAALLNHAMQVMKDRGEPFTFLMPAAREIYEPFGFEFIYTQSHKKVCGKKTDDLLLQVKMAEEEDCESIAEFANEFLKDYQVVVHRDARYYETLLKEYKSENGGVLIAQRGKEIVGVLCYGKGEAYFCMEPLFEKETDLQHAIYTLNGNEREAVKCIGYGVEGKEPMIMAKILQPDFDMELKNAKVFLNEVV